MSRALFVGVLAGASGAALVMVSLSGDLFGRVPPASTEITAPASDVAVIDGGTLRLGSVVVRLSDLVAPARGEACAAGPDCGGRASAALAGLVRNHAVACRVAAHDLLGRPLARCEAGGQDVNATLVSIGWARADAPSLSAAQAEARAHHRGMWLAS